MSKEFKNFAEIKVGYFGLTPEVVSYLEEHFAEVEQIRMADNRRYDLCIMDISYASHRAFNYIERAFPSPMVLISMFPEALSRIPSYVRGAYFKLDFVSDILDEDFEDNVVKYINDFNAKKSSYLQLKNMHLQFTDSIVPPISAPRVPTKGPELQPKPFIDFEDYTAVKEHKQRIWEMFLETC